MRSWNPPALRSPRRLAFKSCLGPTCLRVVRAMCTSSQATSRDCRSDVPQPRVSLYLGIASLSGRSPDRAPQHDILTGS